MQSKNLKITWIGPFCENKTLKSIGLMYSKPSF